MKIVDVPFGTADWSEIPATVHLGEAGKATWRTVELGNVRVRLVEYSPGYKADHWCKKGHVLLVLKGELMTELDDGREFLLKEGMSYHVGDDQNPHRSQTTAGATLFIVD